MNSNDPWTVRARINGRVNAILILGALASSLLLPALPLVLGTTMIVATVLYAVWPSARLPLTRILRAYGRPARRRMRLAKTAALGATLIVCGSYGAKARGKIRSEWSQRATESDMTNDHVDALFAKAQTMLAAGEVAGAEILLIDAAEIGGSSAQRRRVDDLLDRVRRSNDSAAILEILATLSEAELDALQAGTSVPAQLDFGERALTRRAVETALAHVDDTRRAGR